MIQSGIAVIVLSMDQIDLFKNLFAFDRIEYKNKTAAQKCKYDLTMKAIP